jgi:hypothetical protein
MIRRTAFEVSGGFRKAYRHAEDYDLWLRMLEKFNLANIDEVLLGYRRHKKAVSFHSARQQAISALCARITAQMRLRGEADRTSQLDLIEEATLIELGVNQDAINEAILSHIIAVTEDLIRSGVSSAAAEFPEMARTCASPARIRSIAMKLNQKALGAVADRSERRTHRARLLATCPEVYWELFGSGRSKYLRTSS